MVGAGAINRSLVKYHGGKWVLAPWIISQFPSHRIYVEPFGGGGSVLLRKPRSRSEIYNDLDGEIVNLFRVVRDRGPELQRAIHLTPFARVEFEVSYEPTGNAVEQARRTLVRCMMGFGTNGHNRRTGFRPIGRLSRLSPARDWMNYPDKFGAIIERLRGVVIENRDGFKVMADNDTPDTLHYVDPPYVAAARDKGGDYRHEMSDADHVRLAEFLNGLSGHVVLSGYPSALYDDLFHKWEKVETRAFADRARARIEVLWMKNVDFDLFSLAKRAAAREEFL